MLLGVNPRGDSKLATYARVHEFGNAEVPARSYLRAPFEAKADQIDKLLRAADAAYWAGVKLDPIGKKVAAGVAKLAKDRILHGEVAPPIKPSTARAKGHDTPLLESGRLVNAIEATAVVKPQGPGDV